MRKKVSRRNFARTTASVVAGAAAATLTPSLLAKSSNAGTSAAAEGAAVAKRRQVVRPEPGFGYGGDPASGVSEFRDSIALAHLQSAGAGRTAPEIVGGWRVGTTIPAEYYADEKHYLKDERIIAEDFWLMVDHVSRIPAPGDYFVFEFGRGESVIVLRNKTGELKAFHNVCRHRGSRLCRHDDDPAPKDTRLSVKQLGASGNSPVFRCPYHAWTYDMDGRLISAPNGMPGDFDMSQNGLIPCHVRTSGGFIFLNLSQGEAPDFDSVIDPSRTPQNWRTVCEEYGTEQLKVAVRGRYPVHANWKLVLENFHECYHCGPAHRSLVKAHPFWDGTMSDEQRARLAQQLEPYIPAQARQRAGQGGMGAGLGGGILNVGFATGSLDGKPVAPLLPTKNEYTHRQRVASTAWALGCIQCYDDYVAVVRHTPRGVTATDVEIFWLVNRDAKEGRDYQPERVMALWDITEREDRWIVENNQHGIRSGAYMSGRYATTEGGPSRFVQWYMKEVVQETQP
jgi:phenylpropionate dioxygenase-like ring-hydroxylating dioxygenase large terminal subunit